MKKLLIIALVLFAKSAFAQKDTVGLNIPMTPNGIVYERVYNVPGATKELLFSNANILLMKQGQIKFGNQIQDSALYRVVSKAAQIVTIPNKGTTQYNFALMFQIDCKDNKYRVRIYNIVFARDTYPVMGPGTHVILTAEDMFSSLVTAEGKGSNAIVNKAFNVNELKDIFNAMNIMANTELQSIQGIMNDKDSF